jgi:predicted metallo-beta-lactamase superfamily hydrolase
LLFELSTTPCNFCKEPKIYNVFYDAFNVVFSLGIEDTLKEHHLQWMVEKKSDMQIWKVLLTYVGVKLDASHKGEVVKEVDEILNSKNLTKKDALYMVHLVN